MEAEHDQTTDPQGNGQGEYFQGASSSRMSLEGNMDDQPDPIRDFKESLKALSDAATQFGQARIDGVRVSARSLMLKVALGVLGGVAALVFLVVSMVLLLMGLSGGVARLFGAPMWVGYLVVGAICVGVPLAVVLIQVRRIKSQWLEKLREKYAGSTEIQCSKRND